MTDDLYREQILELWKHPRNKGVLSPCDMSVPAANPSCGDRLTLYVRLRGDRIAEATFDGDGCAISQAAASLLTERITDMTLADARLLTPGDVYSMLGITVNPARAACALLAYGALVNALKGSGSYGNDTAQSP